ncbi:FAD-dependent oxidoreductase [Erythrobacter sp. SCSIO 43205]|uniref:NAD(P)/FAD-dependent oxidoreductase n=1 Tax=Erythrobacter sp. SCSIO 43205 TaxID=2779361 RepID=UPI001CA94541|nr:FAD-dependent oxidoreductase [Erythrobacter sp. SCSIO 43205]UAB77527.1 FAD-dependent oxidoreductase [Erythrobacter sp. SCSIO 43205]
MDTSHSDILIIGAGMAGLSCAGALAKAGRAVRLLDKGRGPGGRMAARRAQIGGETVSFDHGAQYFTARDSSFRETVANWHKAGVVAPWPAAGDDAWVGVPGMNGPIRAMGLERDVRWGVRALSLKREGNLWHVDAGEEGFTANTVLVAVPAEQAAELLTEVAPDLAKVAASVESAPCWAVMAAFEERLGIEADGLREPEAKISWAARNSAKPERAGRETWVLHASPERSREIIDMPKEEAAEVLLADFFAQTGLAPTEPVHLVAHRWLYAMPASVKGEAARFDTALNLGIAGDYLHSPRVEGAYLSGRALAEAVIASEL